MPPFPGSEARALIEQAYGRSVTETFSQFEESPLAAASIAQVHAARLHSGEEVVVKVLRPGMRAVIERDLEVLHALAELAQRYWSEGRRLRPRELVAEYQKTILDELDLMREAANASQLKRNFAGSELLYVPEVYWDYCRTEVMVIERIHGVPISDMASLKGAGTNISAAGRERRAHLLHAGVPPQLLPRRHAPRQHLRAASTTRRGRATPPWTSASSAPSTCVTSTTWRRTSSRCSTATTGASRSCTWIPAGCLPGPAWRRWSRRCARCASRSSTAR